MIFQSFWFTTESMLGEGQTQLYTLINCVSKNRKLIKQVQYLIDFSAEGVSYVR